MRHTKNIESVAVVALLVTLAMTLRFLKIAVTPILEFNFAFLANASTGFLFGPFVAGTVDILSNLLGYMVRSTGPSFPGFILGTTIDDVVYGLILYRKPVSIQRIVIARLINTVLISFLLNPIWLSMMYGKALHLLVKMRLIKAAVPLMPGHTLFYAILELVERITNDSALLPQESVS